MLDSQYSREQSKQWAAGQCAPLTLLLTTLQPQTCFTPIHPNSAAHQRLSEPDNCVSTPRSGQTTREFGCVSGRGSRPSLCRTPTKLCVCRQKGGQCTHASARDRDMLCTSWSSLCYVSNCSNLLVE